MNEVEQEHWRQQTISKIKEECLKEGKAGVVAGHLIFWEEVEEEGHEICTKKDLEM